MISLTEDAGTLQAQFFNPVIVNYKSTPGNPHYQAIFDLKIGFFTIRHWIIRLDQAGKRVVLPPAMRLSKDSGFQWLPLVLFANRTDKTRFDEAVLAAIDAYLAKLAEVTV